VGTTKLAALLQHPSSLCCNNIIPRARVLSAVGTQNQYHLLQLHLQHLQQHHSSSWNLIRGGNNKLLAVSYNIQVASATTSFPKPEFHPL
jgi:hypothetical protein